MSLISDPDYLMHSLRLSYLRNVDDIYGPRLISFGPSYVANPYVLAASLADDGRWPELRAPSSPIPTDDDEDGPATGFPRATGLQHTQTILGPFRSGALGLRVSGRRASNAKRDRTPRQSLTKNEVQVAEPDIPEAGAPPGASISELGQAAENNSRGKLLNSDTTPLPAVVDVVAKQEETALQNTAVKPTQFIPRFKGAAEMEARRKLRMLARRPPVAPVEIKPPPPVTINPELSSSDEEPDDEFSDSEDDFDGGIGVNNGLADDDEFDPDFAATRTPGVNSDSASEVMSVFSGSNSALSTSNSSMLGSLPVQKDTRRGHRLSPVSEQKAEARTGGNRPSDIQFEMVTPLPKTNGQPGNRRRSDNNPSSKSSPSRPIIIDPPSSSVDVLFTRRKVLPVAPIRSALSALLASSSSSSSNPFTELYASISGRADTASASVRVFFPHARNPAGRAMTLNVRKDATVEEVIGFALWNYWEEGWEPRLDEGLSGDNDPKWDIKLSAVGWIMRIAEEDGEVDDDFPPPDRTGKISKFNFDAYAILEASPEKIQENQLLESKIQRRPSRIMAAKKKVEGGLAPGGLALPSISGPAATTLLGSATGSLPLSTSLGPSSSSGPQIFLRIRVPDTTDAVHISTTIPVSAGMYIQDGLEIVCEKRKLNPREYALILSDQRILIPLDRTVASLEGQRELMLVKRSMLHEMGIDVVKTYQRTTDPNASIFNRQSEVPIVPFNSAVDFTAAYKKYTVYRKMPMLIARQERTLALDGQYIHIMPSSNKARAILDSGKTSSFHVKSIHSCQQSAKSSSHFKLVISLDTGPKRYDFEAESPKLAAEIVKAIQSLRNAVARTSTIGRSRRSRTASKLGPY